MVTPNFSFAMYPSDQTLPSQSLFARRHMSQNPWIPNSEANIISQIVSETFKPFSLAQGPVLFLKMCKTFRYQTKTDWTQFQAC